MSEYGALLVENCIDRLLKTLAPPAETSGDDGWIDPYFSLVEKLIGK